MPRRQRPFAACAQRSMQRIQSFGSEERQTGARARSSSFAAAISLASPCKYQARKTARQLSRPMLLPSVEVQSRAVISLCHQRMYDKGTPTMGLAANASSSDGTSPRACARGAPDRERFFFLRFFSYRGCGGKVLFFASFFFVHCRQICRQFRRQFRRQICRQILSFEAYGLRLIFAPDGLAQAADELLDFGCGETFTAFHLIKGNK